MICEFLADTAQALHSLQSVKSHIEQLFQEIDQLIKLKKEVENVKKYTAEVKKKIDQIDVEINRKKLTIDHCQKMLDFPPGSYVRNGTPKPGRVIDLVISGRVPEVLVEWDGSGFPVPETPAKLSIVSNDQVEYFWHGDKYPKLIRRIDGAECKNVEILQNALAKCQNDDDFVFKKAYCQKRIALIDKDDLVNLERAVRQGLDVFYRVGAALAEIRDRGLYKLHGYTDFRVYLKEEWNMGKSKAYRLIDSSEVINNLKSVPHGGHFIIFPDSERVSRELAKLPVNKQAEGWQKVLEACDGQNPTAAQTKAVVSSLNCTDKQFTVRTSRAPGVSPGDVSLQIDNFAVDQLVQIKSDRSDKRLVGYNLSVGVVTQVNPATVKIKIWGQEFSNVSPNDLVILDENNLPAICIAPSAEQFRNLISKFSCKEEIIQEALNFIPRGR